MTSTTFSTDGQNVQVDNIILKLDELAKGYDEILSLARAQLENFTISEDDWSRIYINLSRRLDEYTLTTHVVARLHEGLRSLERDETGTPEARFAFCLTNKITNNIASMAKSHLMTDVIREDMDRRFNELRSFYRDRIDERISDVLDAEMRGQARDAMHQKVLLKDLLRDAFGDQFREVAKEIIEEAKAS